LQYSSWLGSGVRAAVEPDRSRISAAIVVREGIRCVSGSTNRGVREVRGEAVNVLKFDVVQIERSSAGTGISQGFLEFAGWVIVM
jgi:hypothetical protein